MHNKIKMDQIHKTSHIVIIPTPGISHLIPLIELAKRILDINHPFTISFLIPCEGPPTLAQKSVLGALPEDRVHSQFLPPVSLDDVPATKIGTIMALTIARSLPAIRDHLKGIQATCRSHLTTLVADLFGTDAFDVAWEFGMKPYLFFPSNAMLLSFLVHLPKLDTQVTYEYGDMDGPLELPGCVPLRGEDFLNSVHDRTDDAYKWLLHHTKRYMLAEGIMVNSFMELEGETIDGLLQNYETGFPPVSPVGPLIAKDRVDGSGCLTWLDDQPRGSVLFVSFGSGGFLSYDQLIELAYGLEMSEQRFLWVVRPPNDEITKGSYFSVVEKDPLHFLPDGFLDRIKGRGLIVPNWAPQVGILNHESTGGFLTHCGWNSVLESVVNGVPLIAWPLYAEQPMNAVMLSEGIKIALRPKVEENGIVVRVNIAMVVKRLMEGEDGIHIRNKMAELKDAAAKVISVDGSSTKALMEVTLKWKSH